MRALPLRPIEFLLALLCVGLFAAVALRTWGDLFFLHGLAMMGILLFLGYLLFLIMMRQHRERRGPGRGRRA